MKTQKTVTNCTYFTFECPMHWDELSLTKEKNIRRCNECNKKVFFCATNEEAVFHAEKGNCIARESPADKDDFESVVSDFTRKNHPSMLIGAIAVPPYRYNVPPKKKRK